MQFRQSYKNFLGHEMSDKTIKLALVSALEDISKDDFEKFCHQLLDRREAPRVKRNKVENKNRLQIADVLVSHFTEEGALRVTVDLLKAIGCRDEAETLGEINVQVSVSGHLYIWIYTEASSQLITG